MKRVLRGVLVVMLLVGIHSASYGKDCSGLFKAIREGNIKGVKSLLEGGCIVDDAEKGSMYPIATILAGGGNTEILKLLIDFGLDINKTHPDDRITALMKASLQGNIPILNMLIEAGADVNAKDKEGITAVIETVVGKNPEALKILIDSGADVDAKAKDGHTALMMAEEKGLTEIVKLLKAAGAK